MSMSSETNPSLPPMLGMTQQSSGSGSPKSVLSKSTGETPALIPRAVLFGNPERSSPQISPDGKRLAYLAPLDGVLNIWVRTIGREDDRAITRDRGRGIRAYFWAQHSKQLLYVQDKDGDENWRLYAVALDGGEPVTLTPFDGVQAHIIAVPPEFPETVLVGLNNRVPQLHDVYRAHLDTRELVLDTRNDLGAVGWVADHALQIRLAVVPTPEGGFRWLHRRDEGDRWKELLSFGSEDALTTHPLGFSADNETLYILSSVGSNTGELRALDVRTGQQTVLASDPESDVTDVLAHPLTHRIQAAAFLGDRKRWKALDPAIEGDLQALAALHPGDIDGIDRDHEDATWLVAYSQDVGPVVYYTYDRATRTGAKLFSARPALERVALAAMRPVHIRARDGLILHGYLTLPIGGEAKKLPTVINVHGGPWARDAWGYDPESQWLANRGYATLQLNYRGSTGYGKAFINAGDREWGGKMQDDISDAAAWLIEQGIADPKRIGIFGGSYGGYAVLAGLTFTPDLYACGVDIVGPSNLLTFINTIPPYWEPVKVMFFQRVGHPEQQAEFLRARSPLFHIDRIAAPLLIAQGANDPRVKREESLQIVEALRKAGKTVDYMEFADEGHGFARPENRLAFYAAAERFLAKHLGGRAE